MSYTFRAIVGNDQWDLPDWLQASLGYDFSDAGVFSGEYAKGGINEDKVADRAVIVALWDGVEHFDSRFVLSAGSGEDDGEAVSEKFTGLSLLDVFRRVIVEEIASAPGEPITFITSNAGAILINLLTAAQARGAATGITWDFTNAVDSNGDPWDKVLPDITYKLGLKYLDLMRNLVDQGMVELRFDGTLLQAFNADKMGVDRSVPGPGFVELVSGLDYTELPRKWSSEQRAKFSMTTGDEGIVVRKLDNTIPDGPFGREEMAVSQGGTKDVGTLTLVNDAALEKVSETREQLTRKVIIRPDGPIPGVDYRVSDYISERITEKDGTERSSRYRLRSMVIDIDGAGDLGEASIVLNDKFLEQEIRTARKVNGIIGGGTADGGGNGIPVEDKPDTTIPSAPTGLTVGSDAYLDANGVVRTVMILDWAAPTTNTDGSAIADLKEYEVQYKAHSDANWLTAPRYTTDYATISNLDPEVEMDVRVRAWDNSSHVSAWGATVSAVMDNDTIGPAQPSAPTLQVYLGALLVTWDGKGVGGALMPDDYAGCRVHVSKVNNFDATTANVSQTILSKNRVVTVPVSGLDYGVTYYVKLVAYDRSGNASTASVQASAVPRRVVETDIEPGAITVGVVDFDARDLGAQETFYGPTPPVGAQLDDFWVDQSNNNELKRWDGDSWNSVSDTRIAQTVLDTEAAAQSAQDAYDLASAKVTVYYQASAPTGLTATDVNDLWIDSDDNQKVYRYSGSAWVLTDIASTAYIASRATDLVTNGTGYLGNDTNFVSFDYVATDTPVGATGSFKDPQTNGFSRSMFADELIPFDSSKKYKFAWQIKQNTIGCDSRCYSFFAPYDSAGSVISPVNYMYTAGTTTTLAAPLNIGDTTVKLTSAANWYGSAAKPAGGSVQLRTIVFWDYVDTKGKAWPAETLSKNFMYDAWADGGVNPATNEITLRVPWAGPAKPAGTKLSNGSSGGTYMYQAANIQVPTDGSWMPYSSVFDSGAMPQGAPNSGRGVATWTTGVPPGTAQIKIGWLLNYNTVAGTGASQMSVASVSVSDASAAQATADLKTTVFSQTSQPSTLGRVNGDMWYDSDDGFQLYIWTGSAWTVSDLGVQAVNFTARQLGAITTYWQASQPASGMLIGDLWIDTDDKNKTYRWSGSVWSVTQDQTIADALTAAAGAQATADGKVKTFAQAAAPTASGAGDLWVDTDDSNKLYRATAAGSTSWVLVNDSRIAANVAAIAQLQTDLANAQASIATARAIADGLVTTYYQTSPPASSAEGDLWVDTDDSNKSYRRSESGTWVLITDTRVSTALSNAAAASAAADGKITSYYQPSAPTGMTDSNAGDLWFDTDDGNKSYWYRPSTLGVAGWVGVPFGGNAIAPGSLSMSNMVSEIRASLGQIFFDDMSDLSRWSSNSGGSGTFLSVSPADAEFGKYVGESSAYNYRVHTSLIPFDPDQLYKITWRVRRMAGVAVSYFGLRTYQADGVTPAGANSGNCYVAASAVVPGAVFTTYTGYVKGTNVAPTATAPKPDPRTPGTVDPATRFLTPLMLSNYSSANLADKDQISMVKIEAVPTGLVERANIALAAINSALIEDLAVINAKIADLAVTNAKINDLAANKITTAELAAGVRIIAGPESGTHAELTATGFRAFIEDPVDGTPNEVVRIGTDNNDTIAVSDSAGNTLATIDETGRVNATGASLGGASGPVWYTDPVTGDVSLQEGVEIYGTEFQTLIDRLPRGNVAFSYRGDASAYSTTEQPYIQLDATLESGRLYHFHAKGIANNNSSGGRTVVAMKYRRNNGAAQTADPAMQYMRTPNQSGTEPYVFVISHGYSTGVYDGSTYDMSLLLTVRPEQVSGSAARFSSAATDPTYFWIDDMGVYGGDTGVDRSGGTPPPTKKTYTTTWKSTTQATYQGDGSKRSDTSDVVQGYNSYNGDGKGLWIFPSMTSTLAGSVINSIKVYAYANHWYYNSGGTALVKLHGYSSAPASSPSMTTAVSSASWPKPGGRWVTIPSSFYAGFISGAYRGFGMGPAGSTNLLYYGRFNGGTGAQIQINYTK